jgi:uncharacterized protein
VTLLSRFLARTLALPPATSYSVAVERDLRVPMPDAVELLADRYAPRGGEAPLVLVRSPYGRRGAFGLLYGRVFAERGFQVLVQSCRGTFGSGGTFDPFGPDERRDGLATVEWMRRQPWYPGSFATSGPSYLGITQWAIAGQAGPEHRAMGVQVTASDPRAVLFSGGALGLRTMLTWVTQVAHQERRLAMLRQRGLDRRLAPLFDHLPLGEADALATGRPVACWQAWLAHGPADDAYWASRRFCERPGEVTTPVTMVGGWYDFLLPAMLRDHAALREAGREPRLTIGPWLHADENLLGTGIRESIALFRARLSGDESGLRPSPVRVFVTGAEEWRDLPAWPPAGRVERWHLQAEGGLAPSAPEAGEPDRFVYDPARPTPSVGGAVGLQGEGRVDNRPLEARADVLTYTSAPLERDLQVAGTPAVDLFVRSSAAHADVFARLCDVDETGRSVNVCDGLLRLSPDCPPANADGRVPARFDLWPAAHRFRAGHRLRLQVSGGAHPRFDRNPGTGEPPATGARLVASERQVHHDPTHPSALLLPIPD